MMKHPLLMSPKNLEEPLSILLLQLNLMKMIVPVHKLKCDDNDESSHLATSGCNNFYLKWEEDQVVLEQQNYRIQALMEDNHCLMSMIATLKFDLEDVRYQFDSLSK